ncbi:GntR family transcriptional regulator [Enterococcus florum]|uniref:GntR family transcriptional regulator n=1 Tax=Enterococcus florum TaxID=2480627 RepID=A0A4P5P7Q5_9ENTE|nr:GntR family transcriptional regulator [Enterococcus florum]GCF92231.1 GntR family transcriptional regulator [Enterococcus florum]
MEIIPKYEKKSLSDMVVTYIKNRILSGTLKSGDRLIESEISTKFNISRAPVREAMRILNEQGIISFSPRKGNHVVELTSNEILEVFEIRASLETQILRKILRNQMLVEEDFQNLTDIALEMKNGESRCATNEEKVYLINTLDISFHNYLWQLSGSIKRAQILEGLFYQLLVVMNEDVTSLGIPESKTEEHLEIIEVLKTNNLPAVVKSFHQHIQNYVKETLPEEEKNFCLDC